ncbi:MAG: glutamate-5-semialdehyde dehydrogenase [Oscillospiraceae bacterium]|nr:glutamate-5-semialdehyde dehydrogenase [Oscillospiraceae bacterium]
MSYLKEIGGRAKSAAFTLSQALTDEKNNALLSIAEALESGQDDILAANAGDLKEAEQNGMGSAMLDRLRLNGARIKEIADAVRNVAALPEPVGKTIGGETRPNGLEIVKVTVPLGVVGIIFESRPNVTVDCAALCLKSGNACILRGGKEAIRSNAALVSCMQKALEGTKIPPGCIQLVEDTSRETAAEMMRLNGYIDVLIPRGGKGLIQSVVRNATVPVIETGAGNCHVFVDESAKHDMAVNIVNNAKTQRPSVCNAVETLLIHKNCADALLPEIAGRLSESSTEIRGCEKTLAILGKVAVPACEDDYMTEFGDYIIAVKVVGGIDEAIRHIEKYSTRHSEAIVTESYENSRRFLREVDSAAVYVNASTRFTDGGVFGLGAEIGISTQKLHARGPMGLTSLLSTKYMVTGSGQIRV